VTGKSSIGCEFSAEGFRQFQTFNTVKNKSNPTIFIEATAQEVNRAVEIAQEAFLILQTISTTQKADFLEEIFRQILAKGDELLDCFVSETGLTIERAISERTRLFKQIHSFAELVRKNAWREASIDVGEMNRNPKKPDLRKMLVGIGPVVVFGASNFPFAYSTAGGDTISAFAAGCPVIVKSHPLHAGTGELLANAIVAAVLKTGMPKGIFSNLNAIGLEVGKQLVLHPKIKAVGFTGSISGGRALFDLANSRPEPIPVFAEMGSVNPVVILPETLTVNNENWSNLLAESITSGVGQFCTNPGLLLLLESPETTLFLETLVSKVLKREAAPMLHTSILERFESAKQEACKVPFVSLNEKKGDIPVNAARQTILTVNASVFKSNPLLQEEMFGPFTLVVICKSINELEDSVAVLKGQLTGTIMGSVENTNKYNAIITTLHQKVGRLIFNEVPTGVEVCPSMHHGGPYPATTDSRFTAVGTDAIKRFARPIVYQNFPEELLPEILRDENRTKIERRINGERTKRDVHE
jgi:NADP-dependent aldehyde dehydrogenase